MTPEKGKLVFKFKDMQANVMLTNMIHNII